MAVALRSDTERATPYSRALRADATRILRALRLSRCELSVALVDDAAIRELNRRYRRKDRATDVLSFSQLEAPDSPPPDPTALTGRRGIILGDVVIAIDTALRQAHAMRITPSRRLRALLIHGILHLIGYDHERSIRDARRMFAREREIAAELATRSAALRRRPK